jgi:hypothetical protein
MNRPIRFIPWNGVLGQIYGACGQGDPVWSSAEAKMRWPVNVQVKTIGRLVLLEMKETP